MKKIDSNEIVKMRKDGLTYKEIKNCKVLFIPFLDLCTNWRIP